jgi:hypothetical protein
MIRWYFMPNLPYSDTRLPKYLYHGRFPERGGVQVASWHKLNYGLIDACLVWADLTQEQHEQLAAEPDVAAVPLNLDETVSDTALPRVKAVMEALRIPAEWVTTAYTYRTLLRMVAGLMLFACRYHAMHNEQLIDSVAQLDVRWNQIPSARQNRIKATADDMGYDYSAVQPTWLVRRILLHLAQQWGVAPILIGGLEL